MTAKKLFLLSALILGANAAAYAARHYVTVPTETALKSAINTAAAGDTVIVAPSLANEIITFTQSVNGNEGMNAIFLNKNITIIGNGITFTTNLVMRIINVDVDRCVTISGVKFRDIHNTNKYGAVIKSDGQLTLNDCIFENNSTTDNGIFSSGIINVMSNNARYLILNRCVFLNNTSTYGGAILGRGATNPNALQINDCLVLNCGAHPVWTNTNCCGNGSEQNDVINSGGGNIMDRNLPSGAHTDSSDSTNFSGDIITWNVGNTVASDVTATFSFTQKTLTISGTGAMQNFAQSPPWAALGAIMYIAIIRGGVSNIGNNAFKNCAALRQVRLPNSRVNTIGANAFADCSLLTHIFLMRDTPPSLDPTAFNGLTKSSIGVFVPTPSAYMSNADWSGLGITSAY